MPNSPLTFPTGQPVTFQDAVVFGSTVTFRTAPVGDAEVKAGANVAAAKLESRQIKEVSQAGNVVTATYYLHAAKLAGVVDDFRCFLNEALPTGDRSVSVDLQKSTGAAAFATILSAAVAFANADGSALRTAKIGTIAAAALVAGDILRVVVTYTAGTTGTVPQGLLAQLNVRELSS